LSTLVDYVVPKKKGSEKTKALEELTHKKKKAKKTKDLKGNVFNLEELKKDETYTVEEDDDPEKQSSDFLIFRH